MQFGLKKLLSLSSAFLLTWFGLRFLLPLFAPFLFGAALAFAAEPLVQLLCKKVRLPRSVSAGIGVSMTFALLCALLLLLCAFVIRELGALAGALPDLALTVQNGIRILRDWLFRLSQYTPDSVQPLLQENVDSLFSSGTAMLEQTVRYILGFAGNLLSHIPDSALTVGTAVLSSFMISTKLPKIRKSILHRFPRERLEAIVSALQRIRHAGSGWLKAQIKLMGVTFLLLALGFFLLRIPRAIIWAAGVSLVDAFPVLGTGTVLIPWSILLALRGDTARAVGMLGIYAAVSLIRSALEPKLVGRHLGLDPLVTLITLYAGFKLWGIAGMLLAPLLTVSAVQILPERKK